MTGWAEADEINGLLLAGDIALFPGTHSVLWEQAIGLGLPAVIHRWPGINHLDLGGNTLVIENADDPTLDAVLLDCAQPGSATLADLTTKARTLGPEHFSYSSIARKAIRDCRPQSLGR